MKKRKGQAAIEFLTTYSWAIMGILLTIGALSYFDIFNTERFIAERCDTGAQISCVEAALDDRGDFHIRLSNNYPVDITITGIEIKHDNEPIRSYSMSEGISRGEIETIKINDVVDGDISNKASFDLIISFRRTGGSRDYDVSGLAVVRQIPFELI